MPIADPFKHTVSALQRRLTTRETARSALFRLSSASIVLILLALLSPAVAAQAEPGAKWVQVDIKSNWQQTSAGFCRDTQQCLVSNAFSELFDNIPDSYWDGLEDPDLGPHCINNTQFILDNYCDSGRWSSRTRLVATQLLGLALNSSPTNFSLYCDSFDHALNNYAYSSQAGPVINFLGRFCRQEGFAGASVTDVCTNSICVLKYSGGIAFGTSMNSPTDGSRSILGALDKDNSLCQNAIPGDGRYKQCDQDIWYNHITNSILYAPGVGTFPNPQSLTNEFFITPYNKLRDYVAAVVNKPEISQFNYSFFRQTPQFTNVYMAKNNFNFVYSFKQQNVTLSQLDYAGWYFSNINLPNDSCTRLIKRFDGRANCELQPSPTEYYIVAHRNPPVGKFGQGPSVVEAWPETTGKLRVIP